MTLARTLQKYPVKNATYYQCYMWEDKTKYGKEDDRKYKTKRNADKRMKELTDTAKYKMVVMRKDEIWLRDENNEFSASSPIETWEV